MKTYLYPMLERIAMKEGDFVEIGFVGRIAVTNEIFDLTSEEVARNEGIYNPKQKYGPVLVIIGAKMVIPGMEKELLGMKVGDEKGFNVLPEKGFGFRDPGLVKVISIANFVRERINPVPGMFVTIDNKQAKVQSVSGGRVRIDFNNPLAGKELTYKIKIIRQIKSTKEKVKSMLDYYGLDFESSLEGDKLTLTSEKPAPEPLQKMLEGNISQRIKELKGIRFVSKENKKKTPSRKPAKPKQTSERS